MGEQVRIVESVCPECLERISGHLVRRGDEITLEKECSHHGHFSSLAWKGKPEFSSWYRPKTPYYGGLRKPFEKGCPLDCGLCEQHTQRTCTALVEVTSRCNLNCPVCFADSGKGVDVELPVLKQMFVSVMEQTGGCNLQLSGGEPTVRDDLPQIIEMAVDAGFTFIQLNTNGIRLGQDLDFVHRLRAAGLSSVFLQFDGLDDGVYKHLRGRPLFQEKYDAVQNISIAGIGIVLVPTVVRGLNTKYLWDIVQFGLEHQPHVRGVHFQPMTYFGRFPSSFRPDHFTLPEVMSGLVEQSNGVIQHEDFKPPGCEHALCSFSAKYLTREDGELIRLGNRECDCTPKPAEEGALQSISVTARQWGGVSAFDQELQPVDDLSRFLARARTHIFAISGMAFQDCWSLSLERLHGCCIHVAQPDGKLIPFCSFNLTSRKGITLHRPSVMHNQVKKKAGFTLTSVDGLVANRLALKHEMTRLDLEQAQLRVLRNTIRYAVANSRYYEEWFQDINPDCITSLSDLEKIPFLTSSDIYKQGHRLLCTSQSKIARMITLNTSGSTGAPKRFCFSLKDLATTSAFFFQGMHSLINVDDRVLVLMPFETPDSVGRLLIDVLVAGGIHAEGMWPPQVKAACQHAVKSRITCMVGLPQHLLAVSTVISKGLLKSMLLCSDYAPLSLRERIEDNCGCRTFLHYGTTESGLGGAVECQAHNGCHIRESDLLIEIVDPVTGKQLPDGEEGEVVLTTLQREAMVLLRYRTGDIATLDRSSCLCGGVSARLLSIRGRMDGCLLVSGGTLFSQDMDDHLFSMPGLLDYRVRLVRETTDVLHIEYQAVVGIDFEQQLREKIRSIPAIRTALVAGSLAIGTCSQVVFFAADHTFKRTIKDQRTEGEEYAVCS